MRIVPDRDVMLEGNVQPSEIFSYQYDVDIVVPPAWDHAANGTHIGIKTKFFTQTNVDYFR
jgi:hypothetical protein